MSSRLLILAAITSTATSMIKAQQTCLLTLVNETGFNEASINLSVPFLGNQTQTSDLSGTVESTVNINTDTDQSDQLTFNSADIDASDVTFNISGLVGNLNISSSNLKADVFTITPPGAVTPATGSLDATQHGFSVNNGTLSRDGSRISNHD